MNESDIFNKARTFCFYFNIWYFVLHGDLGGPTICNVVSGLGRSEFDPGKTNF